MKLVLFDDYIPGALTPDGVMDFSGVVGDKIMNLPPKLRMTGIIEDWENLKTPLQAAIDAKPALKTTYTLQPPQPKPAKMPFASGNYNEGLEGIAFPIDFFMKSPASLLAPTGDIVFPEHDAQLFFHEAELGVIIGKTAKNVKAANAMDVVFGYLCVNDVSTGGLPGAIGGVRSKCFDTFCPTGPCIVTKDEIHDPHQLHIRLWIDDVLRQDYMTSDMEHKIPQLIEWLSAILTLEPGDLLSCGTNHHGIGPIQNNEIIKMTIDGIGTIENKVVDSQNRKWPIGPDDYMVKWVAELKTTGTVSGPPFRVKRIA